MISNVRSPGYSQGTSRVQKPEQQPAEARQRPASVPETSTQSAAVVRIGSDARARAAETDTAAAPEVGAEPKQRAEVSIEPVVSQPVPDFNASRAGANESTESRSPAKAYAQQAPTSNYQVVA